MQTNLPQVNRDDDSAEATKVFFETYGEQILEFSANDVEATIGFFQSKGFDLDAAQITASVVLKQAKTENLPVFRLLDTLKGLNNLELSSIVGEILNNNRPSTSALGFKVQNSVDQNKSRDIAA
jgi:hypothetical protein